MSDQQQPEATDSRDAADQGRPRDRSGRPGGGTDSDDTSQADAGMVAGTGAVPTEGTEQPLGTERDEDDQAR